MSTRCQIGFYESKEQRLDKPNAIIYRHSDGYPDTEHGVLAALLPWAKKFNAERGLTDSEYAAARGLVALIVASDHLESNLGYGICGDHQLHGDHEFYYRVDPHAITVYKRNESGDEGWAGLVVVKGMFL